jgi:hypothetical protein
MAGAVEEICTIEEISSDPEAIAMEEIAGSVFS